MKLKALIISQNTQNERIEDILLDLCNVVVEEVEKIMGDEFWCGQDDATFFIAVDPKDIDKVDDDIAGGLWHDIDSKDYPWDRKPGG